jgi:hypothetical protein
MGKKRVVERKRGNHTEINLIKIGELKIGSTKWEFRPKWFSRRDSDNSIDKSDDQDKEPKHLP